MANHELSTAANVSPDVHHRMKSVLGRFAPYILALSLVVTPSIAFATNSNSLSPAGNNAFSGENSSQECMRWQNYTSAAAYALAYARAYGLNVQQQKAFERAHPNGGKICVAVYREPPKTTTPRAAPAPTRWQRFLHNLGVSLKGNGSLW